MKRQLLHRFEDIIAVDNLLLAWRDFARGKKKRLDVSEFSGRLMDNILTLHRDLTEGAYDHGPYRAFNINDPKPRQIHKATVRDRVVHRAVYRILYWFYHPLFIADSYSCQLGKGTHRAINRLRSFAYQASQNHTKTPWILQGDIRQFFPSINHEILLEMLRERITDSKIIWLLNNIIRSFNPGLPLGNLTSQLLVNIYLNEFDQFVKHELKVKYYLRYADDFVILSPDPKQLTTFLLYMEEFLSTRLRLSLHPNKVSIKTLAAGIDFLGWIHFPDHRVLRTSTKRRMCRKLINNPNESSLNSYLGLLKHGNTFKIHQTLVP